MYLYVQYNVCVNICRQQYLSEYMHARIYVLCMCEKNKSHRFLFVDNVYAMSPVLAEDSVLLTLPFGGAVLQKLG